MQSFGIPNPAPDPSPLPQAIADHNLLLGGIVNALTDPLSSALVANDTALHGMQSAANRRLGKLAGANNKAITALVNALGASLASRVGAGDAALNAVSQIADAQGAAAVTVGVQGSGYWCWIVVDPRTNCASVVRTQLNLPPPGIIEAGPVACTPSEIGSLQQWVDGWNKVNCHRGPPRPPPPPPAPPPSPGPGPSPPPIQPPPTPAPPPATCAPCLAPPTGTVGANVCEVYTATCAPTVPGPSGSIEVHPIGSAEWCGLSLPLLQASMAEFGKWVITVVDFAVEAPARYANELAKNLSAASLIPGIEPVIKSLTAAAAQTNALKPLWEGFKQAASLIVGFDASVLIGIECARAWLKLARRMQVGWDLAVWGTVDISIELAQLERLFEYVANSVAPMTIPGIAEVLGLYVHNVITEPHAQCLVSLHGGAWELYSKVAFNRREKLDAHQIIEWGRRNQWADAAIDSELDNRGYNYAPERFAISTMYDALPSIADHLHWLQRNVFDDQYVADYQLMDGFDVRFWPKFGADLYAQGMKKDYAALHYAAHWILPAPGQLLDMAYRLRPGKPGVQNPFSLQDYARLLAEQDVAPYFRPRFAEIANRIPALGYLRDMYRQYILDDQTLASYHMDLGYSEADATRFVQVDAVVRSRQRVSQSHGFTPSAMASAFAVGLMDAQEVDARMSGQGWTQQESADLMARAKTDMQHGIMLRARTQALRKMEAVILSGLKVGALSQQDAAAQLAALGFPQQYATSVAASGVVARNISMIDAGVREVRKAYLDGRVDLATAGQLLTNIGIQTDAIIQYQTLWQLQRTPGRKRRTASQIVNDVANGMLTTAEAMVRLTNLGYDNADEMLFLADAQRKIVANEARLMSAQERLAAKNQAAIAKVARDAQSTHDRAIAALRREASPSTLMRWAADGIIGWDQFHARMDALEYTLEDQERYWREACERKGASCVNGAPSPPPPR